MNIPYFLINKFKTLKRQKNFDYYISFNYEVLESEKYYFSVGYIYYDRDTELTEIKIDTETHELTCLNIVSCYRFLFLTDKLILNGIIKYQSAIAIACDVSLKWNPEEKSFYIPGYGIEQAISFLIFPNAIVLYLPGGNIPNYDIEETDEFGVIADKYFNIIAFVIQGITPEEIESLKIMPIESPKELVQFP